MPDKLTSEFDKDKENSDCWSKACVFLSWLTDSILSYVFRLFAAETEIIDIKGHWKNPKLSCFLFILPYVPLPLLDWEDAYRYYKNPRPQWYTYVCCQKSYLNDSDLADQYKLYIPLLHYFIELRSDLL